MTSGEYLKQLEKYLRKLPQSDYEDAMEYFTEYFADAGPENEQAVIKELGTPKQAAAELMRNLIRRPFPSSWYNRQRSAPSISSRK